MSDTQYGVLIAVLIFGIIQFTIAAWLVHAELNSMNVKLGFLLKNSDDSLGRVFTTEAG